MKLDITEIMNRRKARLDFSFDFEFPDSPDGALLPAGVTLAGSAQIDCRVRDVNGFIKADFTVHAPLKCVCVRCLEEFEYPLEFSFERFAELDGGDDLDCDADEVLTVKDSALFPEADIAEEISLEAPFRPLCSEDCPGLCPKCGKKLRDGPCSCAADEVFEDPRMDALRRLRDSMEDD